MRGMIYVVPLFLLLSACSHKPYGRLCPGEVSTLSGQVTGRSQAWVFDEIQRSRSQIMGRLCRVVTFIVLIVLFMYLVLPPLKAFWRNVFRPIALELLMRGKMQWSLGPALFLHQRLKVLFG